MKTVLTTISATLAVVLIAGSLFANSILGAFGLAVTSAKTLQALQASHKAVELMKKRYKKKKLRLTKRAAKRSARRIATAGASAVTIGTAAVIPVVLAFEAKDYCDDKKELLEESDILNGTKTDFDFGRCIEEAKEESKDLLREMKDQSLTSLSRTMGSTTRYGLQKWSEIKHKYHDMMESGASRLSTVWDRIASSSNETLAIK